jgi:glutathione S-transferase
MTLDLTHDGALGPNAPEVDSISERTAQGGRLGARLSISRPAICKHVRLLAHAGLIRARNGGRERIYELEPSGAKAVKEMIEISKQWVVYGISRSKRSNITPRQKMTIRRSIWLKRSPETSFKVFCEDIGDWWPRGFAEGSRLFLDRQVGGRLFERRLDGTEYEIGRVTAYEPPSVVAFTWCAPSWELTTQVEIRFSPEREGTRVDLEHSGWEQDPKVAEYRQNYDSGWQSILGHYESAVRATAWREWVPMKLYVLPPSPRALKVIALKNYLGLDCEMQLVDLSKDEHLAPAYGLLNPNRKMPVLAEGEFVLWESNAILQYLASKKPESGLWPKDSRSQADVLRWMFWESSHWDQQACGVVGFETASKMVLRIGAPDPSRIAAGEREFHRFAAVLNNHIRGRSWLVGNALTIADFSIGAWIPVAGVFRLPIDEYPEILKWYKEGLAQITAWQSSLVTRPTNDGRQNA